VFSAIYRVRGGVEPAELTEHTRNLGQKNRNKLLNSPNSLESGAHRTFKNKKIKKEIKKRGAEAPQVFRI